MGQRKARAVNFVQCEGREQRRARAEHGMEVAQSKVKQRLKRAEKTKGLPPDREVKKAFSASGLLLGRQALPPRVRLRALDVWMGERKVIAISQIITAKPR